MIFTVIPAKPFSESKTRLESILSNEERARLSRVLLIQTISVAKTVGQVVVVSRSMRVREVAKANGAWAIVEAQAALNPAIKQGLQWVVAKGAKAALVLPIDLPLLSSLELQGVVNLGLQTSPSLVIAPCYQNEGTNALLLHPPTLISPQFGLNSFTAHQVAAKAINLNPQIYHSPGLALDLDTPEDWQKLNKDSLTLNTLYSKIKQDKI